jgi:hypothetical protein
MSRKPFLAALGVVAVASVIVTASSLAAGGSGKTINFIEVGRPAEDRFIDHNGNQRPDPGDSFMATEDLYRWAGVKRGAHLGRSEVICTLATRSAGHCTGTFFLPGGTIQAAGYVQLESGPVDKVAIVGGTGIYAGARGTFTSRDIGRDVSADSFRLLP